MKILINPPNHHLLFNSKLFKDLKRLCFKNPSKKPKHL
ncbi:hypothetical protein HPSA_01190 [Helicobacter pylori SouthAfrica7]|uniref:Uncharacterized protein n=1 Tax=Helicobacter pylori (strain SouthAfrica7) TaxID=907239 RepID=E8QUP4_HELPW|nr:hypothetical protein HPSA_01190 [Helicobacter pylori SouthAfrica7]